MTQPTKWPSCAGVAGASSSPLFHPATVFVLLLLLAAPPARADETKLATGPPFVDLADRSIEELMQIQVSLPSGRPEKLSHAAAAIAVITPEDIRRSGAMTIPDALRLVPGLIVGQVDAHTWAVSSRGFNDSFANKLLVLQDGRSIYTPLFSGVFWDVQDTLLEDLDRIEVIRGPGATLWGANAVNGVINIVTKPAKETQGFLVLGGGGTEEHGFAGVRYGAKLAENAHLRVYGKYFIRDDSKLPTGFSANDQWQMGRGGFRLDWEPSGENVLTFQGDLYGGSLNQTFFVPTTTAPFSRTSPDHIAVRGGNVLGRWSHNFSAESQLTVQAYYDRTYRDTVIFQERRQTFDLDLRHRFAWGERQEIVWGGGYRVSADNVGNTFNVSLIPDNRRVQLFSGFTQDEISLLPDRLRLTLGSKFEHNDSTGFEIQPSSRLTWTPHERHTLWASVSRAVRTPSRAEEDIVLNQLTGTPGVLTRITGSRNFKSEELLAYELGYRVRPVDELSLDLTGFYNDYDRLRSVEPGAPIIGVPVIVPAALANNLYGETYGGEAAVAYQAARRWRLQAAYALLRMQLHRRLGSTDASSQGVERTSPRQQASFRSSLDLPGNVELDCTVRYMDSLPASQIGNYVGLEARLAWRPTTKLELAVVGRNLLDNQHPEFRPSSITTERTEVERSLFGRVTWRF